MWLIQLEASGFLDHGDVITVDFHRDLNILTGRNGAGKTSLLKLAWFIISGNIVEALREVPFDKVKLTTSEYICSVYRTGPATCRIDLQVGETVFEYEDQVDEEDNVFSNAEDMATEEMLGLGSSIFFPTFRRIEGGFTLESSSRSGLSFLGRRSKPGPVEEGLKALASHLSHGSHKFVAAISTSDIVARLQSEYSERTEQSDTRQREMSLEIVNRIKNYQFSQDVRQGSGQAEEILAQIRSEIEEVEAFRTALLVPFSEITSLVKRLFNHKGIKVGRINFGDAAEAINSDVMSAGEKQMLSFIAFNGLSEESIVFIDEPELSLHVDWQRTLFSTLQRQRPGNQFIVATHSPFIYAKYPDRELAIHYDRGDAEAR